MRFELVASACQPRGTRGRTVTLKLKFADLELITQSRTLAGAVGSHSELESASTELLRALCPEKKAVRLLGVSISGFSVGGNERTEQIAFAI
jgi:DNA polymerase IV